MSSSLGIPPFVEKRSNRSRRRLLHGRLGPAGFNEQSNRSEAGLRKKPAIGAVGGTSRTGLGTGSINEHSNRFLASRPETAAGSPFVHVTARRQDGVELSEPP